MDHEVDLEKDIRNIAGRLYEWTKSDRPSFFNKWWWTGKLMERVIDNAMDRASSTPYALTAGVFSRSPVNIKMI